ncbi:hypothetical protein Syun_006240 [Stephania yunnanensis]|uniref:3'-5' exonuclease n=1 Tax=Stephania yunnanensis TaxID=152371 RepID=A0AAP0KZL5_9MAGN
MEALTLITSTTSRTNHPHIIDQIRGILHRSWEVKVLWTPRTNNMCADSMAKKVAKEEKQIWGPMTFGLLLLLVASLSGLGTPNVHRRTARNRSRRVAGHTKTTKKKKNNLRSLQNPPPPRDSRRLPDWDTRRTPPKQADVNGECQAIKFKGRVVYSRTVAEVEKATTELLGTIESKGNGLDPIALGFDIEWRPTFRRGVAPRKAAVMQICADASTCYVMHIIHSGIPSTMQSLLEDPKYVKVGVGIANDAVKIWKDYKVCVKSVKELSSLANLKVRGDPRNWSLASLTEKLTCQQVSSLGCFTLFYFDEVATYHNLKYAATDAFVSWHLYQILQSLPDIVNDQSIEQGNET